MDNKVGDNITLNNILLSKEANRQEELKMHFKYCPECGSKLIEKEIGDEGKIPFCENCGKPLFDMFSTCILALVVNEYHEAALLRQKYISDKYYNLVSGYMKLGETAEITAEREVYEEIGIRMNRLEFIKTYWFAKKDMLMIGFIGKADKMDFILSKEVDSAEWIPVDQAIDLVHPKGSISYSLLEEYMNRQMNLSNKTIHYYNLNAKEFTAGTVHINFEATQNRFLEKLSKPAYILDFGCGSGRDTKYFLKKGYKVSAIDGSKELCKIAENYTGIAIKQMFFQDLNEKELYDGIWACSSILHLPENELKEVLNKMTDALKAGGVIYTSFKYGNFEGERNGRYFKDFTEKSFEDFVKDMENLKIEEQWITGDARINRSQEKWLNVILRKGKKTV